MTDLPKWITEGSKVAVRVDPSGWRSEIVVCVVTRITTTQIVLDNGLRADRSSLKLRGRHGRLLPLTDREVTTTLAQAHVSNLRYELNQLLGGFKGDAEAAAALVDEARELVAARRARLDNLDD